MYINYVNIIYYLNLAICIKSRIKLKNNKNFINFIRIKIKNILFQKFKA